MAEKTALLKKEKRGLLSFRLFNGKTVEIDLLSHNISTDEATDFFIVRLSEIISQRLFDILIECNLKARFKL